MVGAEAERAAAVGAAKLPPVDAVLVAYSGGKDSLATLDLCLRAGKRVEAFFMYFLPDMDYTEHWCSYAERRFRVKVHRLQHPMLSYYLRRGVFGGAVEDCPAVAFNDVEALARERSGMEWVGYGYKMADSPSRRSYLTFMADWGVRIDPVTRKPVYAPYAGQCEQLKRFTPILDWSDREVKAYLSRRNIMLPGMSDRKVNGIALIPSVLAQLREMWPEDYRRILRVFPEAAAQADRVDLVKSQRQTARAVRAAESAMSGGADSPTSSRPGPATMATARQ